MGARAGLGPVAVLFVQGPSAPDTDPARAAVGIPDGVERRVFTGGGQRRPRRPCPRGGPEPRPADCAPVAQPADSPGDEDAHKTPDPIRTETPPAKSRGRKVQDHSGEKKGSLSRFQFV